MTHRKEFIQHEALIETFPPAVSLVYVARFSLTILLLSPFSPAFVTGDCSKFKHMHVKAHPVEDGYAGSIMASWSETGKSLKGYM